MRIDTPCRGIGCRHNQCFDALSYLQLQEQAPTWTCPVCNKTAAWEHLVLDMYMMDVLDSTSKSIEEVTVEPDGRWHLGKEADAPAKNGNMNSNLTPSDDGDSDDLIEITDNPAQSVNREYHPMTLTARSVQTPPLNSRYDSRAPSTAASASRPSKRPRTNVIDLTLSDDDDDDQPLVKHQRLSMSSSTNSFRARPPDRVGTGTPTTGNGYSFFLPPPNPLPDFDFDRFGPSF
jgi:E3 SUMO-protein ligase PIAS1